MEAFADDARKLSNEGFREKHGSGFLMVTAARVDGRKGETTTHLLLDGGGDSAGRTADLAIAIFPLRGADGSESHLVTIGRESRHDVVIPDASVSRFHAFLKRSDDGGFLIQDVESTNGTHVNGTPVPVRGSGPPLPIKVGDTVRLGQVEFTFTDAAGLRDFVFQTVG